MTPDDVNENTSKVQIQHSHLCDKNSRVPVRNHTLFMLHHLSRCAVMIVVPRTTIRACLCGNDLMQSAVLGEKGLKREEDEYHRRRVAATSSQESTMVMQTDPVMTPMTQLFPIIGTVWCQTSALCPDVADPVHGNLTTAIIEHVEGQHGGHHGVHVSGNEAALRGALSNSPARQLTDLTKLAALRRAAHVQQLRDQSATQCRTLAAQLVTATAAVVALEEKSRCLYASRALCPDVADPVHPAYHGDLTPAIIEHVESQHGGHHGVHVSGNEAALRGALSNSPARPPNDRTNEADGLTSLTKDTQLLSAGSLKHDAAVSTLHYSAIPLNENTMRTHLTCRYITVMITTQRRVSL